MSICLNWEAITTAADLKHTQFGEDPVTCFLILNMMSIGCYLQNPQQLGLN
jgi:hypothetical protein